MSRIWKKASEKNASGEFICSLKETFFLYRRAISLWRQKAGGLFLFTGLHEVVKVVNPYCMLYFTARLLNEIAGLRRKEELFKWALMILAVTMFLSLLQAVLFRVKMAYELLSQIRQAENCAGHGLCRVYWHFGWILEELFKILGAVALSVSLFTMKVPAAAGKLTVLNNPVCILVLLLCILGTGLLSSALDKRMLSYENQIAEEEKFENRCFRWTLDFFQTGGLLRALSTVLPVLFMGIIHLYVCLKAWAGHSESE